MKYTHMAWSLVVLSSPYLLKAAEASSSAGSSAGYWEVAQVGSLLARTKHDATLKPSAHALQEVEHCARFRTKDAEMGKWTVERELKRTRTRTAYFVPTPKPITNLPEESTAVQDIVAEQRREVFAALQVELPTLKSTACVFHSKDGWILSEHVAKNKGNITDEYYTWEKKDAMTWRPEESLMPAVYTEPLSTLVAMKSALLSSVYGGDIIDYDPYIKTIESIQLQHSLKRNIKDEAAFQQHIDALSRRATELFGALNLSPVGGYYVRAVIDELRADLEKLSRSSLPFEKLVHISFGTKKMVHNNRPAVVALCAEVVGAVQDPTAQRKGFLSYLGTYEPIEVKKLNEYNLALKTETNPDTIGTLSQAKEELFEKIHAEAVNYLNSLVKQEAITTDKLRAETKAFESEVHELRTILRQLNELQSLQANLHPNVHLAHIALDQAAASSSNS